MNDGRAEMVRIQDFARRRVQTFQAQNCQCSEVELRE